jgi:hypothetical protein
MLAMHVKNAARAGPFMQVVDVLGDDQQLARPFRIEPREREMRRVRLLLLDRGATHVVEPQHEIGVARESLRRRDILDPVLLPQPSAAAERVYPALRAHARAGEDDNVADGAHGAHEAWRV